MEILQCIDIIQYILSYTSPIPYYARVCSAWRKASSYRMEQYIEYLNTTYPSWRGKRGHIVLNQVALQNDWDLFKFIMYHNTAISCDDAMRIARIFHKDLLIDKMYGLYRKRNAHQPIRSWYMWMKGLRGKNAEWCTILKNICNVGTVDMMGYATKDMCEYAHRAYSVSIMMGDTIFEESSEDVIIDNIASIRFVNRRMVTIFQNADISHLSENEPKYLHPILYKVLDDRGLFRKEDVVVPTLAPVAAPTLAHDGICNAMTKKGVRCKKKASYVLNGVNVCHIHK